MGSINTPREWRQLADDDLRSADVLTKNMYPIPTGIVCFHCQQAIEKYLKGYLASKLAEEPPYIHDLIKLEKMCENYDSSFSKLATACALLTEYAVTGRYDVGHTITETELRTALNYAAMVKEFVKNVFPGMF